MKGIDKRNRELQDRIDNLIKSNKDKKYIEGFYYYLKSNLNELSSQYNYLCHVLRFINFTNKNVSDLNLDDYTIYLGKQDGKTSSYKIVVYASLKKFSKYLKASEINTKDPMQYINRPKYIETTETKQKRDNGYLTTCEIRKLMRAIDEGVGSEEAKLKQSSWKERDKAIISLFLTTGIRLSAMYTLDVNDIDITQHIINVKEKGSKYKTLYLGDETYSYILSWLDKRDEVLGQNQEEALFISNRKKRMSSKTISQVVEKYGSIISNKHITPHKLRHTFGTQLYNRTKDINLTKNALGHSNIHTTELYINGNDVEKERVAEIMNQIY